MPKLTQRFCETVQPDPAKRREIPDAVLPGLYLVVQPSGAKSWAVRYRHLGLPKKLTIGPFARFGLGEAREAGRLALQQVSGGIDPSATRKAAIKAAVDAREAERLTFKSVVADFIERHAKRRNKSWQQAERVLKSRDLAEWQGRDVRSIGRRDVLDALDAAVARGAPVAANRLLAHVRKLFAWAIERGIVEASPASGLRAPSPEASRDRVLDDDELRAIWLAAGETGYPFGKAVQLLILTGARRGEVFGMTWREIDLEARAWSLPSGRAKSKVAHHVHLSEPAAAVLASCPRIGNPGPYVFTTTGKTPFAGFDKATGRLHQAAAAHMPDGKALEPWRLHDLRRTFASGCARLGIPVHVVERCLNHTSGTFGGIVGVYQRHEFLPERRHAMESWAGFVTGLVEPRESNVVGLARVR